MKTYKEFMSESISKLRSLAKKPVGKLRDTNADNAISLARSSAVRFPSQERVVKNVVHDVKSAFKPNIKAASKRLANRVGRAIVKKVGL